VRVGSMVAALISAPNRPGANTRTPTTAAAANDAAAARRERTPRTVRQAPTPIGISVATVASS
jgi:hypothetical protein